MSTVTKLYFSVTVKLLHITLNYSPRTCAIVWFISACWKQQHTSN